MTNFDLEALALEAHEIFNSHPRSELRQHLNVFGNEWLSLYNSSTGQSRLVLLHLDAGFVFKSGYGWGDPTPATASRRHLCDVFFDEDCDDDEYRSFVSGSYPVRLPEFYYFDVFGETMEVAEFVDGTTCCERTGGWCGHARVMTMRSGCSDAHSGNYIVKGKEIVLIDFDGVRLP